MSETIPNRPSATKDLVFEAAKSIAVRVGGSAEAIARNYRHPMDGYELAKKLDAREGWDCSLDVANELDSMPSAVEREIHKAEIKWQLENNIQPPYPIGAKITKGVITGIYEHGAARYLVKEPGCNDEGRHLIVRFEDAILSE